MPTRIQVYELWDDGPTLADHFKHKNYEDMGFSRRTVEERGYVREVEATVDAVRRLRAADFKVLVGGDYGLNITPHGTYAKDLEYFVDLFGMSPTEAMLCATRDGGATADPSGMVGTLEEGKIADMVIVDGDPIADIRVLQDHDKIVAVVKGGQIYQGLTKNSPYQQESISL